MRKKNHLTTVEYNTLIKSIKALIYDYQNKLVNGFPAEGHAGPGEVENPDGEVYTIIKELNAIEASDSSLYTSAKIENRLRELKTELEGLLDEGAPGKDGKDGKLLLKGSLEINFGLKTKFFSNGDVSTGEVIDYDWVEGVSISGTDIRCKNIIPNSDLT